MVHRLRDYETYRIIFERGEGWFVQGEGKSVGPFETHVQAEAWLRQRIPDKEPEME